MSRSHDSATAQHFPEFAQNFENYMRKLKIYAFNIFLGVFFKDSHILCDFRCDLLTFFCAKFQNQSFDRAKRSTFRMSGRIALEEVARAQAAGHKL